MVYDFARAGANRSGLDGLDVAILGQAEGAYSEPNKSGPAAGTV